MKYYLELGALRIRIRRDPYSSWGHEWISVGGLALIAKTNGKGGWNLASYHSPHSLTWRWILTLTTPQPDQGRWIYFHRYRDNQGLKWHLGLAKFSLAWQTQQPMWYRDMYMRMRDEEDQRRGMLWLNDKHPHKIHTEPKMSVPTSPPPAALQ